MDFRNKYLKYKPEITFDIFQKVWDKLIENGYIPIGKYDVERGFGDFKTLYCYLRTTETHPMNFNCYSVIPALFWVETTVQEILGYDPFVRGDDFILPEKWYVLVTNETVKDINMFKSKTCWKEEAIDYKAVGYEGVGYNSPPKDYTEITFDQFKKHVLKQEVEKSKEVIPEYVEALIDVSGYFIKGNIYKVESSQNIKSCRLISNIKSGSESAGTILLVDLSNNNRFKPSTKSAFDLQNQPKQPLKQAVHCETQEQWDFVIEKLGYEWTAAAWTDYGNNTCVNLEHNGFGTADVAYIGYQILPFSDWCAQNNYDFLSTEDKYKEVLRKNARTLGGEVVEIDLADYDALLKNMFDFNVSEQTANNISETIDRVRYRAMQTAQADILENALKSFTCDIQHYDHEFLAQMIGGKVSKVNKVQISTDNEIKINIIQKQSIKI